MENFRKREPVLPDVDVEWKKFQREVIRPSRSVWRRNRIAATVVLTLSVSILSFAVGVYCKSHGILFGETVQKEVSLPQERQGTEQAEFFEFASNDLQAIVQELGLHYGMKTEFRSEEAKHLRLHVNVAKHLSLQETVDLLNNFREVHVRVEGDKLVVE